MLNKTLREFLLPYTEAQRPEVGAESWHEARAAHQCLCLQVLKLVLLHGTLCLQKTFGQKRLTIAELRQAMHSM